MSVTADFTDLPGYTDGNGMGHDITGGGAGVAGDPHAVLRTAWLIIIVCLVGLWLLGYTFK